MDNERMEKTAKAIQAIGIFLIGAALLALAVSRAFQGGAQ